MEFISEQQFRERLSYVADAPKDGGVLKLLVVRPKSDARELVESCHLSLSGGAEGDNWVKGCWKSLEDGSPDPDVQLAIMNYRVLELIAGSTEQMALAGDALCVDFDLSDENLKAGDRLRMGEAVLEVTSVPHNGCGKFQKRFGKEALTFINSPLGKSLHLRGIYVRVVEDGVVKLGDTVSKLDV